ncbi:hypothetical protein BC2230_120147 [Burkholderia cepacia]
MGGTGTIQGRVVKQTIKAFLTDSLLLSFLLGRVMKSVSCADYRSARCLEVDASGATVVQSPCFGTFAARRICRVWVRWGT